MMTEGPWIAAPSGPVMQGYNQPIAIGQKGKPNLIAGVFGDVRGGFQTAEANARAIAALPLLIQAVKNAHAIIPASEWPTVKGLLARALFEAGIEP